MNIVKHGFDILLENEITYFAHFAGIIDSVDEFANVEVTKSPLFYIFRISPSTPEYCQPLLKSILDFHNLLRLRLRMGKSMKSNSTIFFKLKIKLNEPRKSSKLLK